MIFHSCVLNNNFLNFLGSRNVCMAPMTPTLQKITSTMSPKSVLKRKYEFHRAVEKLVQEKFVPSSSTTTTTNVPTSTVNGLDTSSESGYGSDQDSLNNQVQAQTQSAPALPPRKSSSCKPKRKVKFDSYVMLLQGLKENDLDLIISHLDQVSDEAMMTQEISAAFLKAILENRQDIVTALLNRGFDVNATADSAGLTGLHLAAAFNYLPMVKIILTHGACIFALAHSSGKKAADLCSRNLPGYQACHAYLRCMEECLGVANQCRVYSSQTFHTARNDELQLVKGQCLKVLRKGDYQGSSWWWCQDQNGRQGYVLRDILCLHSPWSV